MWAINARSIAHVQMVIRLAQKRSVESRFERDCPSFESHFIQDKDEYFAASVVDIEHVLAPIVEKWETPISRFVANDHVLDLQRTKGHAVLVQNRLISIMTFRVLLSA